MITILKATKELLGIPTDVTDFDTQLVVFINTTLLTLSELGFGTEPYQITNVSGSLEDYLPDDEIIRGVVQTYIWMKVRIMFDPPTSAFLLSALQTVISEYEFRLQVYEPPITQ